MNPDAASTPATPRRWQIAVAFAALSGAYAAARVAHEPGWPTDFDQLWHAARALVAGGNPYAVVGPGREFQWDWPLYYPLPAVILSVPFVLVPVAVARVAFSTVSAALLGWAIAPRVRTHWPLLLSAAYLISMSRTQWAPLLLAAAWWPALGFVITAKPNVGLAVIAAHGRRGLLVTLASMGALVALSFVVRPGWVPEWLDAVSTAPHVVSAILLPGGFLFPLALLRWRRPDAWLFLAFVALPHTPSLYDLVVLFFIARNVRETIGLALLTHALFWGIVIFGSFPTFDEYALGLGSVAVFVVYLPALATILRRPNRNDMDRIEPPRASGMPGFLPEPRVDAILMTLLVFAAAMLIWLPLVTYR